MTEEMRAGRSVASTHEHPEGDIFLDAQTPQTAQPRKKRFSLPSWLGGGDKDGSAVDGQPASQTDRNEETRAGRSGASTHEPESPEGDEKETYHDAPEGTASPGEEASNTPVKEETNKEREAREKAEKGRAERERKSVKREKQAAEQNAKTEAKRIEKEAKGKPKEEKEKAKSEGDKIVKDAEEVAKQMKKTAGKGDKEGNQKLNTDV